MTRRHDELHRAASPGALGALALGLCLAAACGSSSPASGTCGTCPVNTVCDGNGRCVADPSSSTKSVACTPPVAASSASSEDVQSLGTVAVGDTVAFVVPEGAVSVTVVEQAVSAVPTISYNGTALDNVAVPLLLTDATGATFFDDSAAAPADGSDDLAFFASDAPGTGTLTVPNTSAALAAVAGGGGLVPGTWHVTVSDYAYECVGLSGCSGGSSAGRYDVTVLVKRAASGAIPPAGTIDLAFYFATTEAPDDSGRTTTPLEASTASTDVDLGRMVTTLRGYLLAGGMQVGSVTFHDLPADVQAAYATGVDLDDPGACSGLGALLRNAGVGGALDVFLVSGFTSSDTAAGYAVVGVDGTVPGPATFAGTRGSGVAVSTADLRAGRTHCAATPSMSCGADATAYVVAHEAGHFLGLYHTTEAEGTAFDPLADTGKCPCSSCKASTATTACGDHLMTVAECSGATSGCDGGSNLMFWVMGSGSTGALTAEQAAVMRANPLVR